MPKRPSNAFLPLRHLSLDALLEGLSAASQALYKSRGERLEAIGQIEQAMRRRQEAERKADAAAVEIARAEDELQFRRRQGYLREHGKPPA